MIEQSGKYPVYKAATPSVVFRKVSTILTYEQMLEIANIFYYVRKALAILPRFLGGIRLLEDKRALHDSIHHSMINCCLSLEEAERIDMEGKNNHE